MHWFQILVLFALLPLSAEEGGAGRLWTHQNGEVFYGRLHGIISSSSPETVVLADKTGRLHRVESQHFSEADQAFLQKEGWEYPKPWLGWPNSLMVTLADSKAEVLPNEGRYFRYRSKNFLIKSEIEIAPPLLNKIARTLEGIYLLLESSPWGNSSEASSPRRDAFDILIFANQHNYVRHGGVVDSAACYVSHRRVVMLPYRSLLELGQHDEVYNDNCLVHEVTHLLMSDMLQYLPIWLVEGIAEYMELIELRTSMFRPRSLKKRLLEHHELMNTKVKKGRAASLQGVFTMSHQRWRRLHRPTKNRPATLVGHYHASLLLTYYFMHLDGQGKAERLSRFMKAALTNRSPLYDLSSAVEQNEQKWDQFLRQPEIRKDVKDGYYSRPSHLDPPPALIIPQLKEKQKDKRFLEYAVLRDGRTQEQLIQEALAALKKQGFEVH